MLVAPLRPVEAQDVDVPGNLTIRDSSATVGNVLKEGVPFIHNFGTDNTFIGKNAGNLTLSPDPVDGALSNTAVGVSALLSLTTGAGNTASGAFALRDNTEGRANTASGARALLNNTTGVGNTASGNQALLLNTTGGENTGSGANALIANTTGSFNTAIGNNALANNTTGSQNTAIGFGARVSVGDLTNATAIGAGAVVDDSNKIRLGNTAVTLIEAQGDFHASGPGNGIILKSPNGAICGRLGIDDTGALVTAVVACP
jgi:hypothetical protein